MPASLSPRTKGSPQLPAVVTGMKARIDGQPDRPLAAKLWAATYVLMGLRFERAVIDNVLAGVMQMEESVTYQAILQRGREDGLRQGLQQGLQQGSIGEARALILRQGRKKFGPPTAKQEATVNAIADLARLERLSENLLDVTTWGELLKSK